VTDELAKLTAQHDPFFDTLALLDRLEELREDMRELGIASIEELDARIAALEAQIDDEPPAVDQTAEDDGPV
jgi:hypothetical protein